MNTLIRTKSGMFSIKDCKSVEELRKLKDAGELENVLIPTSELFKGFDKIKLNKKQSALVQNGVSIMYSGLRQGCSYRLYSNEDKFLCISEYIDGKLKLKKAFWS